jgi:NAD+ kinase
MKIALYARKLKPEHISNLKWLFELIQKHQFQLSLYEGFYKELQSSVPCKFETYNNNKFNKNDFDLVISYGGDGTFLDAVSLVGNSNIPMLGINAGRLGFLAYTSLNEIELALLAIKNNEYTCEERSLITVKSERNYFGKYNFAMNDLTIHRKNTGSMMSIEAHLNDEYLNTYWADGLIVATPTGSTAYSLSCGGPLMMPQSNGFIINPIAPHNLNVRAMVFNDTDKLHLKISGREPEYLISLDSRTENIFPNEILEITKADFTVKLIQLKDKSFLNTLRQKLNWGFDKRN